MTRHADPFGGRSRRTGCGPEFFAFLIMFIFAAAPFVYFLVVAKVWEWTWFR